MASWRRALVTGASSGIGRAFAELLAERGCDLVVVARSGDALEALAEELRSRHGVTVEVHAADLTDPDQLRGVEERVGATSEPVDLLINNAGFGQHGRAWELDIDVEEQQIRLNVLALVRLTHAALRRMVPQGSGAVLNVSSIAGIQPTPFTATYGATKAFVTHYTQAVAEELRGTGVRIAVLAPGFVRTAFQQRADYDASRVPAPLWMQPRQVAAAGLAGLARGRTVIVPGAAYRAAASIGRIAPPALVRRVIAAFDRS